MNVTMIGTGYVGLVTGTCFAESGNRITCVDIDAAKVERLNRGEIPIYEPGLEELVRRNLAEGRLRFSTDLASSLADTKLIYIAVGTPQSQDGSANLSALWGVAAQLRKHATESKVVVVKSTVPVGTNVELNRRLNEGNRITHLTLSNPEFLKEGHAVEDFMKPDRVVVGANEDESVELMQTLYAPFLRNGKPLVVMSPTSAEMTKYAANALLATKISFINDIANLCETIGADINDVRTGIGHDPRIGFQFLHPGPGYGGSCFPKDVRALIATARSVGRPMRILGAVDEVNETQKGRLFEKVRDEFAGSLRGKTIAIWGLAFKPSSDDIREAPALVLIDQLLEAGANVRAFDPKAMANVREEIGDRITYAQDAYDALNGCDALVIVTEWSQFRSPDFARMRAGLKSPIVIDGRNLYDLDQMTEMGFTYRGIGRVGTTVTARNVAAA